MFICRHFSWKKETCILRKKWMIKFIFCMQISMKACYKMIAWFWWRWSGIFKVPKIASFQCPYDISKKNWEMKFIISMRINIKILLQVAFQHFGLGIKLSYRVILSLLMGLIQHCQSSQSNKYGISWQYLKKEVRNGVHFLHADKHQSSYNLALSFLMEVARHVQSTQNRKLVIFLQYIKVNESLYRRCGVTQHFPKTKK